MRTFFAFVFALTAVLLNPAARAQFETTTEMLALCGGFSDQGPAGQDFCEGYLSGVLDAAALEDQSRETPLFCFPPDGVTVSEAIATVESYARQHPDSYDRDFLSTIYMAMLEKYPCPS